MAQVRGQKLSQMALSWILKDKRITSVLIGASRVQQITEAIESIGTCDFSQSELERIDAILN
jgi:L-glyceraldehyde 3-phosphate reductase